MTVRKRSRSGNGDSKSRIALGMFRERCAGSLGGNLNVGPGREYKAACQQREAELASLDKWDTCHNLSTHRTSACSRASTAAAKQLIAILRHNFRLVRSCTFCFDVNLTTRGISAGRANPALGYIVAFLLASMLYIGWLTVINRGPGSDETILLRLGAAVFFWAFGGVAAALVLMVVPWALAAVRKEWVGPFEVVYWPLLGAALTVTFGCGTSSLAPKPLFIGDQTFSEGFVISLQRQGFCLVLVGLLFGSTYWYVSERGRPTSSTR